MMILAALALAQTKAPTTDVARLVRQVRAAYANCKSYRDTGTQVIWNVDRSGTKTIWGEWKFKTAFARPAQIRLEVSERKGQTQWVSSVLWTAKETTRLSIGFDGSVQKVSDVLVGLSSLTSLCFGIADRVPLLLLPLVEPFDFLKEHEWKYGGTETLRKVECYVLQSSDAHTRLWIDKRTSLVVQFQEKIDHSAGQSTLKVVHYTPVLNSKVLENEFRGPA